MEATGRDYCPIAWAAWLPPGHDPGAGGGAATTACGTVLAFDILERRRDLRVELGNVGNDATGGEATARESSERGDSCRTGRSQLRSCKRAFRERATSAGQA